MVKKNQRVPHDFLTINSGFIIRLAGGACGLDNRLYRSSAACCPIS